MSFIETLALIYAVGGLVVAVVHCFITRNRNDRDQVLAEGFALTLFWPVWLFCYLMGWMGRDSDE